MDDLEILGMELCREIRMRQEEIHRKNVSRFKTIV